MKSSMANQKLSWAKALWGLAYIPRILVGTPENVSVGIMLEPAIVGDV